MSANVSKQDYQRFVIARPNPDFNEARTRAMIEDTIKKTDENHKRKRQEFHDKLGERSEALGSYFRHLVHKNDATPVEKYLGKKYLTQLIGERHLAKIRHLLPKT